METLLTSLIDLALLFMCYRLSRRRTVNVNLTPQGSEIPKKLLGKLNRVEIQSKLAEKMADRAFNMASSANIGIVSLQKALVVPRLMTKQQTQQNQVASKGVEKIFSSGGNFDWLRPILSDDELEILDKAEEEKNRQENGNEA